MKNYTHRDDCRLCGSTTLELVLPILPSPIGDAFVKKDELKESQDSYPLDTYLCLDCGHLQNLDVVNPEVLFRNYTYKTSASKGLVDHFNKYAQTVIERLSIQQNSFVIEIGSNDGSLLKAFKNLGLRVLGVDPAKAIASKATLDGVKTIPEFFSSDLAQKILAESGSAQLMCANNVFAHSDNISDIVKGIRTLLADDGVFVFEVSYILDMIDKMVFDTIYHEHVSHHALIPLERLFNTFDMTLFDVEKVTTKGGSIRGFAQPLSTGRRDKSSRFTDMIAEEIRRNIFSPSLYKEFYDNIENCKISVLKYLDKAISDGKKIAAYGASTTTTTLMYHFELQTRIQFIVDDNDLKHGTFSPGAHIPVLPSSVLYSTPPDVIVILAWQYAPEIIKKHEKFIKSGGCFLVPLPTLQINQ